MEKKIMLTGLQPTGTITLGNYIGAIKQMVENQRLKMEVEKYKRMYLDVVKENLRLKNELYVRI